MTVVVEQVTTKQKKGRQKIEGPTVVVRGEGAHLGLRRHCKDASDNIKTPLRRL